VVEVWRVASRGVIIAEEDTERPDMGGRAESRDDTMGVADAETGSRRWKLWREELAVLALVLALALAGAEAGVDADSCDRAVAGAEDVRSRPTRREDAEAEGEADCDVE
jgi:hypothetical protein